MRAEIGGFEASPADADADAMAEAEDPALMPSMASLAPRRGTAELSTAPFPFRPFLFFSLVETNPIFPFGNLRKSPRCRKWPHRRDPEVKERLPSNAIFGRPGLVGVEEGVREASGSRGASHGRRRGGKKVCLPLGVRTASTLVISGPHDDGAHPRCGNPDPWFHLFSRWCR